jgi:hypothetical protein
MAARSLPISSRRAGSATTTALEIWFREMARPPVSSDLRVNASLSRIGSPSRRARRPVDDLVHPDEETVSADDANRDDRPDAESEQEKSQ